MNDEPTTGAMPDPAAEGQGDPTPAAGADLDDTQRVDVPRYAPTPDPRPDDRWAWASAGTQPASDRWYEPAPSESAPGPYGAAAWGGSSGAPSGVTSGATSSTTGIAAPAGSALPEQPRRRGAGIGTILAASLLSAVLASAGTVLLLDRSGAFDQPAAASSSGIGSAQATAGTLPITINESSAIIDAAAKVGPAVVKITTEGQTADPFGSVPSEGVGSGVIYNSDGWILTNRHVVADATKLTVELKDGRKYDGRVYGIDTLTDLAIVKVDQTGLPVAPIGKSDGLKVGQLVVAVGSPLGMYSFSVTSGIVSGKGRDIAVDNGASRITNLIQTDAAINPGNSGGPLADATGAVVGINTAVATDSSGAGYANGIGFAIPIDIARPIMEQAVKGESLSRPWIGIRFLTIDLQAKNDLGLSVDKGALVTNQGSTGASILDGSPAADAGIKDGDIILSINGITLDQEHPLDAVLVQFSPGDTVTLDVLRDGAPVSVAVTLGTRPTKT